MVAPFLILFIIVFTAVHYIRHSNSSYMFCRQGKNIGKNIAYSRLYILNSTNSTASFCLILSGDIELNPGPGLPAPKCDSCNKTVRSNQKRVLCDSCLNVTHAICADMKHHIVNSRIPGHWTCPNCLHHVLPFFNVQDLNESLIEDNVDDVERQNIHIESLQSNLIIPV